MSPRAPVAFALLCIAATARAEAPPARLTVDEAVDLAIKNQPSLAAARANVEVAMARTREAWAAWSPTIGASATYSRQTANFATSPSFLRVLGGTNSTPALGIGVTCLPGDAACMPKPCVVTVDTPCSSLPSSSNSSRGGATFDTFNYFQASFAINWLLWDWGKTYFAAQAGEATEQSQRMAEQAALLLVKYTVRNTFFVALTNDALVEVAAESVASQQKHLAQMQGFFEVGTRTKVDVAQAQADLAAAQLSLARAKGNRRIARAALMAAIGTDEWRDFELIAPPAEATAPPLSVPGDALDEAARARPEPKQYQLLEKAYRAQAKSVRGAWLPQLALSVGPSFAGIALSELTPNFQASVTLSYPGGGLNPILILAQEREQNANARAARAQARVQENAIRQEMAQAEAALSSAREEMVSASALLAAAKERRELANGRFEAGIGTVLELSDAELQYVNARAQEVQASFDAWIARAQIDRALAR